VCVCVCVCVCVRARARVLLYLPYSVFQKRMREHTFLLITHVAKSQRRLLIIWRYSLGCVHRAMVKCTDVSGKNIMPPSSKWSLYTTDMFSWSIAPTWINCYPDEVGSISLRNVATFNIYTVQKHKPRPQCHVRHMIFEILKPLNTRFTAFWDMTPWSLVDILYTDVSHKTPLSLSSGQKGRPKDRNRGYERTHRSPGGALSNHLAQWSSGAW